MAKNKEIKEQAAITLNRGIQSLVIWTPNNLMGDDAIAFQTYIGQFKSQILDLLASAPKEKSSIHLHGPNPQ